LEDKKWILVSIAGNALPELQNPPELIFNRQKASAGGDSGCNFYGGSYKTAGNKIAITKIVHTLRACAEEERMNIERELLDNLKRINRYEIKAGKLNLYRGVRLLLSFEAVAKT
jgi:heat shock protein HslJ